MSWYQVLLVLHIVAAMVWVGGAFTGMLIGALLYRTGDAGVMSRFCTAFATIAGPLFGGSSLLVLGSGIWMVALDGYPSFSETWVSAGFALWFVSLVLGAGPVGMTWTKIGAHLREPGAALTDVAALYARAVWLTSVDLAVRVAAVVVMVWQPT